MQSYESFGGYPTSDLDRKNLEDHVQELVNKDEPIPADIFLKYMALAQEDASMHILATGANLLSVTNYFHQELEEQDEKLEAIRNLTEEIMKICEANEDKKESVSGSQPKDNP